jgi:hypothetical protein
MGLLDLFEKDRTLDWPEAGDTMPLLFDVESRALNGIALGESFEMLRLMGRPGNPDPLRSSLFKYFGLGLVAALVRGKIDHFGFIMLDEDDEGFAPCRLSIRRRDGSEVEIDERSTAEQVRRHFGGPDGSESYGGYFEYVYEQPGLSLVFEFTGDGRLVGLDICA